MSLKIIDKNIRTIGTNADKLNMLIYSTAMLVVEHAKEHGDCTRAQSLVNAMPASMRRTMLVLWFSTFTPIVVKADNAAWNAKMHKEGTKLFVPFDLEAARETPFFTLAKQNPEPKILDFAGLVKLVEALGKRIEGRIERGEVKDEDKDSARAIADRINALKFEPVKAANANDVPALQEIAA